MRGGVTDAGRTNSEDRSTQPMEAGGRVSQNSYIQEIEASGVPEAGMEWMQSKH